MGRHGGDINKFCVKLSCGCFATFNYGVPNAGDMVFCRRHDAYMHILIPKVNWRLLCRDCNYTVNTGGPQRIINEYASKHVTMKGHRVHVWQDGGPSYIVALRDPECDTLDSPAPPGTTT